MEGLDTDERSEKLEPVGWKFFFLLEIFVLFWVVEEGTGRERERRRGSLLSVVTSILQGCLQVHVPSTVLVARCLRFVP